MDIENNILNYLKEKYHPIAVILHGSRVNGKAKSHSDWDFYIFVSDKVEGGTEVFENQNLDINIQYLPIDNDLISTFGKNLLNAKVLLDSEDGIAKKLLDEIKQLYANGLKLTKREYLNRQNRMQRVLGRLKDNVDDDRIFFYHLGIFYEIAIRYWFEIKEGWSKPVYEALPFIKNKDKEYYDLLDTLRESKDNNKKVEAAAKIQGKLF